jgi:hypothetical protein
MNMLCKDSGSSSLPCGSWNWADDEADGVEGGVDEGGLGFASVPGLASVLCNGFEGDRTMEFQICVIEVVSLLS